MKKLCVVVQNMKFDRKSLKMYLVTDRYWLGKNNLTQQVEESILAGATFVQVREKNISDKEFISIASEIKKVTDKYNIPLVINDNINVAIAINADGVHIGQNDEELSLVRKKIGDNKIIGVSTQTVTQTLQAYKNGANYVGIGAVYPTSSKNNVDVLTYQQIKDCCNCCDIPVVAIGGLNKNTIHLLNGTGVDGVAVISAIFSAKNITNATKELVRITEDMLNAH